MKILSIDTASNICGVSILEDKKLLCQLDNNTGRTHSENLMPMINMAFEKTNLSLKDIGLIVCDKGPGSFTGIRIGVATVKAFADSMEIPCVGISSLETVAYNVKLIPEYGENYTGLVCSILDCKNSNCYFALYKFENGICTTIIEPSADTVQNALHLLCKTDETDKVNKDSEVANTIKASKNIHTSKIGEATSSNSTLLFIGDGAFVYNDIIKQIFPNCLFVQDNANILNSYSLALAGIDAYSRLGESDILPLYLRKPQAQRQLESKLGLTMDINSKMVVENEHTDENDNSNNSEA